MTEPTDLPRIILVPVGSVNPRLLEFLILTLPDTFKMPCTLGPPLLDVSQAYSLVRQQYYSTELLKRLLTLNQHATTKILGVTEVDLFIPILTFVFGEAQLNGPAAIISAHRLRQSFYGLPEDEALLLERCQKEALHELGHTFGLVHCQSFECVMHRSHSVEQVDLKRNSFCPMCAQTLAHNRLTLR
ncbi:MAG: archaemetzincin family Zn-dependent metalloprotease [Acidobacteriota bacterium]|nr:archaemetzincin family Zn-dependent metalloprotease [Acidobacteriota bacterium]